MFQGMSDHTTTPSLPLSAYTSLVRACTIFSMLPLLVLWYSAINLFELEESMGGLLVIVCERTVFLVIYI